MRQIRHEERLPVSSNSQRSDQRRAVCVHRQAPLHSTIRSGRCRCSWIHCHCRRCSRDELSKHSKFIKRAQGYHAPRRIGCSSRFPLRLRPTTMLSAEPRRDAYARTCIEAPARRRPSWRGGSKLEGNGRREGGGRRAGVGRRAGGRSRRFGPEDADMLGSRTVYMSVLACGHSHRVRPTHRESAIFLLQRASATDDFEGLSREADGILVG